MPGPFESEVIAIEGRFAAAWDASAIPVEYENKPFTRQAGKAWVSLSIVEGDAAQATIGAPPLELSSNLIVVRVFAPRQAADGSRAAKAIADQAAAVFRGAQFASGMSGQITCFAPRIRKVPPEDGFYRLNVQVPYRRAEFV